MAKRVLSRREAASPTALHLNRSRHHPIRPWPNLPAETQTQMAQLLAELLRRMHPRPPIRESTDAERSRTLSDEQLTSARRAKLAYIYVRQSSVTQVKQHQESTELQYRLVDRAEACGWPRERIHVIDEDLGKSGAGTTERQGFQKLITEISLGHAGLVISLDASRLARNNRDWHQLLELCSLFGVLIADGERLFDPCAYHDRLLLGLSGIMSEAELHQIRLRLHQGERQKAARGELRLPVPAGLAYDRAGAVTLNPDEEVQARLALVFAKFRELHSAHAVMRYLRANGLPLPVRPLRGPAPHEVVWREATSARVRSILQNPAYAGAYVYGRRRQAPGQARAGSRRPGTIKVPVAEWAVCLQAAHPGYISWEEFMANQRRLADNVNRYDADHAGVPRKGCSAAAGHCRVRPLRPPHEPALHRPERRLSGLLLPGRPGSDGGASLSGGAGSGGGCPRRGDPAGSAEARPDRHCAGRPWAVGPGGAAARAAVGAAARARPL